MIAGLEKRIEEARTCQEIVVNLTHFQDGFTMPEVIQLIKSCNNSFFLGKEKEDGSGSIHCLCKRKKIKPETIELSGIFKDVCVLETWKGLKRLNYNVLPVNEKLVMPTSSNWRNIKTYPEGYLRGENGIHNGRRQCNSIKTKA